MSTLTVTTDHYDSQSPITSKSSIGALDTLREVSQACYLFYVTMQLYRTEAADYTYVC